MPNMDGWKRSVEAEIQKAGHAATAVDDLAAWLDQILKEDADEAGREKYADLEGLLGPRHIFADIAAKRAIIALHRKVGFAVFSFGGALEQRERYCEVCQRGDEDELVFPCATLRLLASAYAARPGYREEWRP